MNVMRLSMNFTIYNIGKSFDEVCLKLIGKVSGISLVHCAYSLDFRYFPKSCEIPVRACFP